MIRQLIIVYQWVVDRWGWVYICRYFSDWNILHSHIFWLQKLASWDWARGSTKLWQLDLCSKHKLFRIFLYRSLLFTAFNPNLKEKHQNIMVYFIFSGGAILTEKFTLQNWDCSKSPQKADFMNAFPKFLFVSISYHFLLATSWYTPIFLSVPFLRSNLQNRIVCF